MNNLLFYCIDSNIICIIILAILLARTVRGVDWQLSQVFFTRVIFFYIVYCAIDIFWCLFNLGYLHNRYLFYLLYTLHYIVSSLCCFYWFVYSEALQGNKVILRKKTRFRYALPLLITIVIGILFLSIVEFAFHSDFSDYYFVYYIIIALSPVFYIFSACIRSFVRFRKTEFRETKKMHFLMGLYPILLFISAIAQIVFVNVPILCYVIVINLLCIYFRSLDNLISIDALTKLNNRNQLYSFIERISKDVGNEKWLFFIDVDKFKSINDNYGHLEGDNALILVSNALKDSCKEYPSRFFIARYGGDEFLIIANKYDIRDCNELREKINANVRKAITNNHLQYNLSVSIGYSLVDFNKHSIEECLREADEKLYAEKRIKRNNIISSVSNL